MRVEERWGENVINQLSMDLKKEMPTTDGLSVTNLRYCRRFYLLSSQALIIHPQVGGELVQHPLRLFRPQLGGKMQPFGNKADKIFCNILD